MDYEKAYKEALERARKCLDEKRDTCFVRPDVIFPELKESEDERIRKELIEHIKANREVDYVLFQKFSPDDVITWLEKQGEKSDYNPYKETVKSISIMVEKYAKPGSDLQDFYDNVKVKCKDVMEYEKTWLEKQGEQKPADKVETKFEIEKGKWYVCNTSRYTDFIVGKAYYCPKNGMLKPNENAIARYVARDCFHPWTIQDAEKGDVLVDVYGNIGIFDKCYDFDWMSCCSLGNNGGFQYFTVEHENEKTYPATKEQRDTFFAKIREEGWEWDEDKKELNKMEQKPANKIEPKFKIGDWVVCGQFITQILEIVNDGYVNSHRGFISFHDAENYHLWTIDDAKEGDVLSYVTDEEDLWIMIYWSLYKPYEGHVHYHALLVNDNFSDKGTCCICINDLKPATKEQRDLLFSNMKESGYEWDEEKKEMKKIEENSFESDRVEKAMRKAGYEWSEETHQLKKMEQKPKRVRIKEATGTLKEMLDNIDPIELEETRREMLDVDGFNTELNTLLKKYEHLPKEEVAECLSFYLEDIQGKPKWTDEDESKVEDIIYFLNTAKTHYASTEALDDCVDWLKSLKQRMEGK